MNFETFDLAPELLRAAAAKGYETATPIQAQAIPVILAGRDLVGCAQTGTGKTAAFALPTLARILASLAESRSENDLPAPTPSRGGPGRGAKRVHASDAPPLRGEGDQRNHKKDSRRKTRALVLAPTRELASQIAASFAAYGRFTAVRHAVIFGGVSQAPQVKALQHGVDIVIATPGRLLDLMQQGHVELRHVEVLILDEADQMLDMGFIPDIRRIIARVPRERQTLMFSATMPEAIRRLADEWLRTPASVSVAPIGTPAEKVDQAVYFVEKKEKPRLLQQWLERTPAGRTLVFARTKHGADKIVKHLMRSRIFAAAIHGNKSQNQRERALEQFKSSRPPVLIATDIAARGLDIKDISHVVNYDLPEAPETYVHRIGRTGRAGASGVAVSFCSTDEVKHLRGIERLTRRRIDVGAGHEEFMIAPPPPACEPKPQRRRSSGRQGAAGKPQGGPAAAKRRRYGTSGQRRQGEQPAAAGAAATAPSDSNGRRPAKRRRRFRSGL